VRRSRQSLFYESTIQAGTPYPLKFLIQELLVTSSTTSHAFIIFTRPNGSKGTLRLKDISFCTDFNTNLVLSTSFKKGDTTGTTKDRTISWSEKTTQSYVPWRNAIGSRLSNMSRKCPFSIHHKPVATSLEA
jgi:hypothetical protein